MGTQTVELITAQCHPVPELHTRLFPSISIRRLWDYGKYRKTVDSSKVHTTAGNLGKNNK